MRPKSRQKFAILHVKSKAVKNSSKSREMRKKVMEKEDKEEQEQVVNPWHRYGQRQRQELGQAHRPLWLPKRSPLIWFPYRILIMNLWF